MQARFVIVTAPAAVAAAALWIGAAQAQTTYTQTQTVETQTEAPAQKPAQPAEKPAATGTVEQGTIQQGVEQQNTAQPGTAQQDEDEAPPASGAPIIAPVTVDPGQRVDVLVNEAADGTSIEVWGPIGEPGAGAKLGAVPLTGGMASVTAPEMPGSYRLRYLSASGAVLGQRAFEVAAAPIALTVTTPVSAGAKVQVTWRGPARPGDRFEVVGPSGAVLESVPIAGDASAENVSLISAPAQPGTYELRYVTNTGAVLRHIPFGVE